MILDFFVLISHPLTWSHVNLIICNKNYGYVCTRAQNNMIRTVLKYVSSHGGNVRVGIGQIFVVSKQSQVVIVIRQLQLQEKFLKD